MECQASANGCLSWSTLHIVYISDIYWVHSTTLNAVLLLFNHPHIHNTSDITGVVKNNFCKSINIQEYLALPQCQILYQSMQYVCMIYFLQCGSYFPKDTGLICSSLNFSQWLATCFLGRVTFNPSFFKSCVLFFVFTSCLNNTASFLDNYYSA